MVMSGQVEARCKECNCRFVWSLDNFPFPDSMIIGTCDKCFDKITHDCYDEFQDEPNGSYACAGRKVFKK